jgi:hypothetical protein
MIAELTSIIETPHFPASESISAGSGKIENSSRHSTKLKQYLAEISENATIVALDESVNYLKSKKELQTIRRTDNILIDFQTDKN